MAATPLALHCCASRSVNRKISSTGRSKGAFPLLVNLPTRAIAPAPQGQLGLGASYFAASGKQDGSAILRQAFVRFKGLGGDKPSSLRR